MFEGSRERAKNTNDSSNSLEDDCASTIVTECVEDLCSGENVEADCETLEDTHSHVTKPSECIYQGRCC